MRDDAYQLVVAERVEVASDVVELTLTAPDGGPLPAWEPGAHIELELGPDLLRQYSLIGSPGSRDFYRIAVLRDRASRGGSVLVHDTLAARSRVLVRGPRNNFELHDAENYLFLAGGIGITPLLSMLESAEAAGKSWRFVYGGRERASMAYVDLLERLGDRVELWPQDERGFIDFETYFQQLPEGALVYCCGPEPFLRVIEERHRAYGRGDLHIERFVPKPIDHPAIGVFDVHLEQSGMKLQIPPNKSILEVLEDAGVDVDYSCREGTCGTCETRVLAGRIDHRDSFLTESEQAAGDRMMICVSRSLGGPLTLDR